MFTKTKTSRPPSFPRKARRRPQLDAVASAKAQAMAEFIEHERQETARFHIISPILEVMGSRWPKLFSMKKDTARFFPFAANMVDLLVADLPQFQRTAIRDAVDAIRETEEYLMATSAGGPRYGLDGQVAGHVSSFEQAVAAEEYRQLRHKKLNRLARMGAELSEQEKTELGQSR